MAIVPRRRRHSSRHLKIRVRLALALPQDVDSVTNLVAALASCLLVLCRNLLKLRNVACQVVVAFRASLCAV